MYTDIENKLGIKIDSMKVLKSGWAGEIVSVKFEDRSQKYVVKTYNSSKNGIQNIEHEWVGLNFLYKANYPVPKPILGNFDDETPYILMEQIEGENLWTVYESASEETRQVLLNHFITVFFRLHMLDCAIAGGSPLKDTFEFIEKELTQVETLAAENGSSHFEPIVHWLRREKSGVSDEKLSILHRDYHPWNVLVDAENDIYVVDLIWGIGDYRFDLAWLCTLMERSGFQNFSAAAFAKYQDLKAHSVENFDYFKVLATTRWLVNVTGSLKTGDNLNETRTAEFNDFIAPLIKNGLQTIYEITRVEIVI